jgi:tetratricopeptide (TPR) repeat protein
MPTALTLDLAQRLHLDGRLAEAEAAYARLTGEGDPSAELLYLRGTLLLQQGQPARAVECLAECVRLRPEWAEAHANLGTAWFHLQRLPEARSAYERARVLAPGDARIAASLAATYVHAGTPEQALALAREALALDPEDASAHWNAALAHLELGQWQPGWAEYAWGFAAGERPLRTYDADGTTPEWDGAPGRTVVLYGEQGLGDEILFASCIPDALRRCKRVILECHPRLAALFRRSFPEAEVYGTRKDEMIAWPAHLAAAGRAPDAKLALGSLPRLFRNRDADFPRRDSPQTRGYLRADPRRVADYRARLGKGPVIGIAWAGGTAPTRADLRTIPLAEWTPVFASAGNSAGGDAASGVDTVPQGARFVSLQYTPGAQAEAARCGIPHWPEAVDDLDEQAALICACDLVISVCQTAVHLAGALGVPTWCLTPAAPAWRYGIAGDSMPWYPTVTLLRQRPGEAWTPVLARTAERLTWWLAHAAPRRIYAAAHAARETP